MFYKILDSILARLTFMVLGLLIALVGLISPKACRAGLSRMSVRNVEEML